MHAKVQRRLWKSANRYGKESSSPFQIHIQPLGSIVQMLLRCQGGGIRVAGLDGVEDDLMFLLDGFDHADVRAIALCCTLCPTPLPRAGEGLDLGSVYLSRACAGVI